MGAEDLTGIGLGLDAAKMLFGGFQFIRGLSQASRNKRPTYEIPQEIQQNLNQANVFAQQGLPDAVYNRSAQMIDRNMAFGLNAIGDRRGGLTGVAALAQQGNDAYGNLAAQDAQARMNNLAQLYNARNTMAGYRDKAFDINQMQPYLQRAAEAQALQGAGVQNIFGSLQGAQNTLGQQQYYNAVQNFGTQNNQNNPLMNLLMQVYGTNLSPV